MTRHRLRDYLDHMRQAATDAVSFVEGMQRIDFATDKRTQQAVVMSLVILGEAATRVMDEHPAFVESQPGLPWRSMRGMRNRLAHGYFEVDLDVVWQTVQVALPDLLQKLAVLDAESDGDQDGQSARDS